MPLRAWRSRGVVSPRLRSLLPAAAAALIAASACGGGTTTTEEPAHVPSVPFERPIVSITFDDANDTQYALAAPLLAEYGYRATYYLLTGSMNSPGRLSTAQAKELVAAGHEMGSHTRSHPDLTAATPAKVADELTSSAAWIEENVGVPGVKSFAFPWGRTNDDVAAAVKEVYGSARLVEGGLNFKDSDRLRLRAYSLDQDTPPAFVFARLDQACSTRTWAIFVLHGITTGAATDYAYNLDDLRAVLDGLKQRQVTVLPVGEAVARMSN